VPFTPRPTVAGGIASQKPVRVAEVLAAMRDTNGGLVTVSEDEIVKALKGLLGCGLYVEPTSASAGAALSQPAAQGEVNDETSVVIVLTGSGLKATEVIGEITMASSGATTPQFKECSAGGLYERSPTSWNVDALVEHRARTCQHSDGS